MILPGGVFLCHARKRHAHARFVHAARAGLELTLCSRVTPGVPLRAGEPTQPLCPRCAFRLLELYGPDGT